MIAALSLMILLGRVQGTPVTTVEVSFCNFPVPRDMMRANASFNIVYSFDVDASGRPVRAEKIENAYVDDEAVVSCLREWRLPAAKRRKPHVAVFHWRHGVGWDQLTVTGPGFSQTTRITGSRCPY